MSRTNIFELLKQNSNMGKEATRLNALFSSYYFVESPEDAAEYTLEEFVDRFCFTTWSHRSRCIDTKDFLETIDYPALLFRAQMGDLDSFLSVIETIYNFWHLAMNYIEESSEAFECYDAVNTLPNSMDECLSEYNQKAFYFPDEEKCIVAEASPQVTAAAEAVEPEVALSIVRYNHRQMAGDVSGKKVILRAMGDYLEGRKVEITGINASLYDTISGSLNNLNIRHNNINPANKGKYKKAVAEMQPEELEKHYDDLYQLILLAILEIDNVERQRDMKALIQAINSP